MRIPKRFSLDGCFEDRGRRWLSSFHSWETDTQECRADTAVLFIRRVQSNPHFDSDHKS